VAAQVRPVCQASRVTPQAFYEPDGALLVATELTRGPWDSRIQHAGPPAALLARAIAAAPGGEDRRIARISCEILRPVPVAPLKPHAQVTRPGRNVDLVDARLETADGACVMLARAWRFPVGDVSLPARASASGEPPLAPEHGQQVPFFPVPHDIGYETAMDWRFTRGSFREPGPAMAWMRMKVPLVAGEAPSPLARVLVAADSGSGVSATLDRAGYQFMNVDLTVHLHRDPAGDWVGLDASSTFTGTRAGLACCDIYDRAGEVGRGSQTLLVTQLISQRQ